jgi:hypothetical protein
MVFAPFSIQCSPLSPETDMLIMMRKREEIDEFFYNLDSVVVNANIFSKKFTVRVF